MEETKVLVPLNISARFIGFTSLGSLEKLVIEVINTSSTPVSNVVVKLQLDGFDAAEGNALGFEEAKCDYLSPGETKRIEVLPMVVRTTTNVTITDVLGIQE
ncbi:hypothetical protein V7149_16885 [Bacillus sp. JJ1503]|uniref:hypothetical protein n=1 Tax=Bacillus sp. JJ1503 TaxID=3122956 RepID=UPI00300004BE